MSNLSARRKKAIAAIFAAIGGIGFVSATPTSNLEVAKQVFMAAANVAMYAVIWDIYFDEELAQKDIKSLVVDLSIITLMSARIAWVTTKAIAVLIKDIVDGLGWLGWGITGVLAGLVTGLLGFGWTCYCDDLYRHPK